MARQAQPVTRTRVNAISAHERGYARTATRLKVARAVWALWEQLRAEDGIDQQWLADRLGKHKGQVSRLLNGPGNWTLDTVADLLEAMEGRLTIVEVKRYIDIAAASHIAPSLQGLRDKPKLWNVVILCSDSEDAGSFIKNIPSVNTRILQLHTATREMADVAD